ncbi:MAG: YqjD family protein [Massilia sp.]
MMEKIPTQTGARDQLMADLKSVIQDAEAWLRHGGQLTGDELKAAKEKFERTLVNAKDDLIALEQAAVEKAKVAARATDDYVKENPWKAVGLGAALGVVVGMLIARK